MNPKALLRNLLVVMLFVLALACNQVGTPTANSLSMPAVTATGFEGAPRHLAWSSDDSHLLITGWYAGEEQIVTLNLDTEEVNSLVIVDGGAEKNGWLFHADWSLDGSQIVFEKNGPVADKDALRQGVWIMDVTTEEIQLLTEKGRSPIWSANGKRVFVTSVTSILQFDVSTGELLTSYPVRPERGDFLVGYHLTRSADDRSFAVQVGPRDKGGVYSPQNNRIYTMNVESGNAYLLDTMIGLHPTWSPNGDVLAFVGRLEENESKGLYLANADGTCVTQVLDIPVAIPAWSHDGSKIAFGYLGRVHLLDVLEAAGEGALQSRLSCQ